MWNSSKSVIAGVRLIAASILYLAFSGSCSQQSSSPTSVPQVQPDTDSSAIQPIGNLADDTVKNLISYDIDQACQLSRSFFDIPVVPVTPRDVNSVTVGYASSWIGLNLCRADGYRIIKFGNAVFASWQISPSYYLVAVLDIAKDSIISEYKITTSDRIYGARVVTERWRFVE